MKQINQASIQDALQLEKVLRDIVAAQGVPATTGNIYYVLQAGTEGAVQFADLYNKKYVDGSLMVQSTLSAALSACKDDRNDVVVLAAGYALTVTASNVDLNKNGVTIIGQGTGLARPTFTFGADDATMTVSADNVTVQGCHHVANYLDVASAYTLSTAKDFQLTNNTFVNTSNILNYLSVVTTGTTDYATDGLTIVGNDYHNLNTTPLAFISILGDVDNLTVTGNNVNSASTADVGHFITFAAKDATNAIIRDNTLVVVGATGATVGIFLTGSGISFTGIVADNLITSLDTTSELIATAGTGLAYFENYYTGNADASGKLWPTVDTA